MNVTAFVLELRTIGQSEAFEKVFVTGCSLFAGIGGLFIAVVTRLNSRFLRWLLGSGIAISFAALAFGYWMGVAYAVYDDPFRLHHLLDGFLLLWETFPLWTNSQLALGLMLLTYWMRGQKLGLR